MIIVSRCPDCGDEVYAKTSSITRIDHVKMNGKTTYVHCTSCNFEGEIHIDEFKAIRSRSLGILALILGVISLLAILGFLYWLSVEKGVIVWAYFTLGIPLFIYSSIVYYDRQRVSDFNGLYVSR